MATATININSATCSWINELHMFFTQIKQLLFVWSVPLQLLLLSG